MHFSRPLLIFIGWSHAVTMLPTMSKDTDSLPNRKRSELGSQRRSISAPNTRQDAGLILDMYSRYPRFENSANKARMNVPESTQDVSGKKDLEPLKTVKRHAKTLKAPAALFVASSKNQRTVKDEQYVDIKGEIAQESQWINKKRVPNFSRPFRTSESVTGQILRHYV